MKAGSKYFVIINPNSGRQKGTRDWETIKSLLQQNDLDFDFAFTQYRTHAIDLSLNAVLNGYRKFIVISGDGTMNEVVNGIFLQREVSTEEIILGMIPIGTGNDWGRMYGIGNDYEKAVRIIKEEHTFVQDAAVVTYFEKDEKHTRYFANMAGMGFDAMVANKTNAMKEKGKGGTLAYLKNLALGLVQYKFKLAKIEVDGKTVFEGDLFSATIAICKYNGGGMMQSPQAIPDDGLLDLNVTRKASKLKVLAQIKRLYDGSLLKIKEIEDFKGKKINVWAAAENPVFLETEGESLGHTPFEFEIIPRSIRVIIRKP